MPIDELIIISGPVGAGKTSVLNKWTDGRNVKGILTPVIEGKRMFQDIAGEELFHMEASEGEETLSIGKYNFSVLQFQKAIALVNTAIDASDTEWILIDEIGPLELEGKGFSETLVRIIQSNRKIKLLIVVRAGLLQQVVDTFRIRHYQLFNVPPRPGAGL